MTHVIEAQTFTELVAMAQAFIADGWEFASIYARDNGVWHVTMYKETRELPTQL